MKKKKKISNITKKYKAGYIITSILSVLCFFGPVGYYIVKALLSEGLTTEKVALVSSVVIVLIMSLIAIITKVAPRCRIWIILLGLYFCLENISTPLIIIASTQITDEIIITPLQKFFKNRYIINKQIDKRGA